MEYASALGTIIFDKSCRLHDLTEAQIGRNQYATDVELERLDGEADHAAERIGALEDKEADMERSLNALLELGQEQTEASTCAARGLGQLATCVLAQQNKIRAMCYVRIPKESGRCRERKVGGSEARPADSY